MEFNLQLIFFKTANLISLMILLYILRRKDKIYQYYIDIG